MTSKLIPRCWLRSIFTFLLLCAATLNSQAEQSGDFTYESTGSAITITAYTGIWRESAVTIPSTIVGLPVTGIGPNAFRYRTYLSSVTIPDSVTSIGGFAFSSCSYLTSVTIPNSVTSIGEGAFYSCISLTSLTIPNSVTSIGESAFAYCSGLKGLTIGSGVIGADAFSGCYSLTSVTIGSGVTSIGGGAFFGCSGLTSVTIGSGVTSIGGGAFAYCSGLSSVTIPDTVTSIGGFVFRECTGLSSVYFQGNPPSVEATLFADAYPTVYYFAGTTGWGSTFAGRPTALTGYLIQATSDDTKGAIVISPSQTFYSPGTTVTVQATPKPGYVFTLWSGSSTSIVSSIELTMNANQSITANFTPDLADSDGDGLTNYDECVVYDSDPNVKDSSGDGINDGKAVALGYSPTIDFTKLISEVKSNSSDYGLYSAMQMQSLSVGSPLLTRDAVSNRFKLTLKVKKSSDLKTFTDLPFSSADTSINAQGEMEFQFTSPDNAAFYRLEAH